MPIMTTCGPHCGIRSNAEDTVAREGHCDCAVLCHPAGDVPPARVIRQGGRDFTGRQPLGPGGKPETGTPMCARWYELAGDYRPWNGEGR